MLVLDRKESQSIIVDGPAVITVTKIKGGHVKIGIDADRSVKILRKEIAANDHETRRPE